MKVAQKKLWQRIEETPLCQFGDDHLLKRVCKHTKWTLDHAREVAKEYRKFLFLATQIPYVVPSKQVDEIWHEHLLFTFDYWEIWGQILGKKLHHFPAGPSKKTVQNLQDSYQKTLEAYKKFFGNENTSIWPGRKISKKQHKSSSDRGSNNYSPTGAGSCGIVPLMLPGSLVPTHAEAATAGNGVGASGHALVGEGNHTGGGFGGHSNHSDGHSDGGNTDAGGGHGCSSGDGGGGGGCGGGCGS